MDIEISPSGVVRAADAVATTAAKLAGGETAGAPGNEGFMFSTALARFSGQMEATTSLAARDASTTAENLEVSAALLRRADDDSSTVARALWSRLG